MLMPSRGAIHTAYSLIHGYGLRCCHTVPNSRHVYTLARSIENTTTVEILSGPYPMQLLARQRGPIALGCDGPQPPLHTYTAHTSDAEESQARTVGIEYFVCA